MKLNLRFFLARLRLRWHSFLYLHTSNIAHHNIKGGPRMSVWKIQCNQCGFVSYLDRTAESEVLKLINAQEQMRRDIAATALGGKKLGAIEIPRGF